MWNLSRDMKKVRTHGGCGYMEKLISGGGKIKWLTEAQNFRTVWWASTEGEHGQEAGLAGAESLKQKTSGPKALSSTTRTKSFLLPHGEKLIYGVLAPSFSKSPVVIFVKSCSYYCPPTNNPCAAATGHLGMNVTPSCDPQSPRESVSHCLPSSSPAAGHHLPVLQHGSHFSDLAFCFLMVPHHQANSKTCSCFCFKSQCQHHLLRKTFLNHLNESGCTFSQYDPVYFFYISWCSQNHELFFLIFC